MSGLRIVFAALLPVILAGALAGPAHAEDPTVEDLKGRVEALEKRITTLERTLAQRLIALEKMVKQGQQQANPLEGQAQAALGEINQLITQGKVDQAKAKMAEFMGKYGSTSAARSAQSMKRELDVIGNSSPPSWGIEKWFQGENQIQLGKGKTTLLVFWEVWCPHCKREVPKIQQIHTQFKDSGLQVVGLTKVNRSSTDQKVQEFLDASKVDYPVAKEDGSLSSYFSVSGVPAAAVVKAGKVVWRGHPARLTTAMLKSWL